MEETVGSRLKALVIAKALRDAPGEPPPTVEQIAAKLGVSYESLRKWTAGRTAPNRKRAEKIAKLLECPAESFMHGVNFGSDDEPEAEAPSYSARALRVAAIYDRVSAKDRRHIDAAADAAESEDGDGGESHALTDDAGSPPPAPTPMPQRPT